MEGAKLVKCSEFGDAIIEPHVEEGTIEWHARRSRSSARATSAARSRTSARSKQLGDVVLFDVVEGLPQGKALDLAESAPIEGFDAVAEGHQRHRRHRRRGRLHRHRRPRAQARHEPRRPARHQRQDHPDVGEGIKKHAPNAFVIVISNPLDAMVTLDEARHRLPEAARGRHGRRARLGALPDLPRRGARRLGGERAGAGARRPRRRHGAGRARAARSAACRSSKPARRPSASTRSKSARASGGEIVGLLKTGSAFYSPASAAIRMARGVPARPQGDPALRRVPRGRVRLEGYVYVGVPVRIGAGGVEQVIEVPLSDKEKKELEVSASHVAELVGALDAVLKK